MALVNQDLVLDVVPGPIPPILHLTEYDENMEVVVTLMRRGQPFQIPTGTTVKIEGTLKGHPFRENATPSGNTVTFTVSKNMTAYSGRAWTKIKLTKDSKPVSTCGFWLDCDRAGVEAETVIGAPGFEEQIEDAVADYLQDFAIDDEVVKDAVDDYLDENGIDPEAIAPTVTDWLNDNVTPVGSAVVVDSSLSITGAAADAAAVGEILGITSFDIGDSSNWERKTILSGQKQDSTTRITLKNYLPISVSSVTVASPYQGLIYRFTSGGEYVGFWDGSAWVTLGTPLWTNSISVPRDSGFVHTIVVRNSDNSAITTDVSTNVSSNAPQDGGLISDVTSLKSSAYRVTDEMEHGTMNSETGSVGFTHGYFWQIIRCAHILEVGNAPVSIKFNASDAQYFTSVGVYSYGAAGFIGREALTLDGNGYGVYTPTNGAKYIKVLAVLNTSEKRGYHNVEFCSSAPIKVVKNLDVRNTTHNNVAFTYAVGNATYTIGQLLLPPNYTVDGDSVPLYVRVHGTGAMSTWTDTMGINGHYDSRYLSQYMANEGFAVFDCYPWTDLYYSESAKISPFNIEIHRRAYIDGIKYVCDRYNVDINRVCMSFKSLGGHLGHWFMSQSDLPVAALAMLSPSTGFASTIWGTYFLQKNAREAIVNYLGLENETNASLFINTDVGMENANCVKFVEDHLREFASLIPASIATHGATYLQHYDRMVTGVDTLPQWMADLGIPKWPSAWEDDSHATGVPDVINHPDLTRYSLYPVKFWHAFDDVNTSGHVDYTIYTWLLNGGSDVEWRTVPWGTGGHNATDLAENAVKVSGTTRLGIAYSDIAESYVEMADFFFKKMCME